MISPGRGHPVVLPVAEPLINTMPLDASQLADLIQQHAAALRWWVRWRSASYEDVVQEAFCRLAEADPPPDRPVAWLYAVCRNLSEKQRRSDGRRRNREEVQARPEALHADPSAALELAETLEQLESLDHELREAVVLRIWGNLTFEEAAALCGTSAATAYRRYQAGLQALKQKLDSPCRNSP